MIKLKSLLNENIPDDSVVVIFKLFHGKKNFVTKMNITSGFFTNYDSDVKAFDSKTVKFGGNGYALRCIKINRHLGDIFGIVDVNGEQELIK